LGALNVWRQGIKGDGGLIAQGRVPTAEEGQLPAFIDQTWFLVKEIGEGSPKVEVGG
jgi:hypothetical protein